MSQDPNALPSGAWKQSLLSEAYSKVSHLTGDLAEFGVYNGHNVRTLATLAPDRRVWAFDTFEGMPAPDYSTHNGEDASDPPGKWESSLPPELLFAGYPNIKPVEGRFALSLSEVPAHVTFILAHIDCDWYNSHKQVLNWLASGHLVPGAILLLDDPTLGGAQRAISEWSEKVGPKAERVDLSRIVWHG